MKKLVSIIAVVALVAIVATLLVACVPTDPAKAEANLKEAGYTVIAYDKDDGLGLAGYTLPDGATNVVSGTKEADEDSASLIAETVTIYYFESSDKAKAYFEKVYGDFDANQDEAKAELKESYDAGDISKEDYDAMLEMINNSQAKRFGKIVYAGTKAAIKAAS